MGVLDEFSIWLQSSILDMGDWVGDAPNRIREAVEDVESGLRSAATEIEGAVADGKELCADVRRQLRELEMETAYNISPELGEIVEKKQLILDRIENLINSPKNLALIGEETVCPMPADHLFIRPGVYTHHGIYVGENRVIHYSRIKNSFFINITEVSLEEFADGRTIYVLPRIESPLIYTPEEAIRRARSRTGEDRYDLLSNNCEQFVRWCRSGGAEWYD